jgi:hypothetical protein
MERKHYFYDDFYEFINIRFMIRKKNAEQLDPIKITKTEANYQSLLLDMMSKLVTEQRESNRLLRRMAGESDN